MKFEKTYIFTFVAPLMILLSTIGLISSKDGKKIFYLPIGFMGIFIISEKELSRGLKRKQIYKKIQFYKKHK